MSDSLVDLDGEELALGVVRNPLDATRRLVLADWYEGAGRDGDAGLMRLDGRLVLTYDHVSYVTHSDALGFEVVVLFRHRQGESIRCRRCKTGIKTREGFVYHRNGDGLTGGSRYTTSHLLRHARNT